MAGIRRRQRRHVRDENGGSRPDVFTLSAWVKTTTTSGGKIVGFGDAQPASRRATTGTCTSTPGQVWFGVYTGTTSTLKSTNPINDGKWHQVVAL